MSKPSGGRVERQVDQRVGSSLIVGRRPPGRNEPEPLIKAYGLRILLVHICRQYRMQGGRMRDKAAADTCSPVGRIDEQRIHVAARQTHEADDPILLANSEP